MMLEHARHQNADRVSAKIGGKIGNANAIMTIDLASPNASRGGNLSCIKIWAQRNFSGFGVRKPARRTSGVVTRFLGAYALDHLGRAERVANRSRSIAHKPTFPSIRESGRWRSRSVQCPPIASPWPLEVPPERSRAIEKQGQKSPSSSSARRVIFQALPRTASTASWHRRDGESVGIVGEAAMARAEIGDRLPRNG